MCMDFAGFLPIQQPRALEFETRQGRVSTLTSSLEAQLQARDLPAPKPAVSQHSTCPSASRDYIVLTLLTAAVSVAALIFYYHQGAILLYGDAVAHINIARRVFDSRTPGLVQLGTVWLPLPHVLDIPFIVNDHMWQTGLGGSIPSMLAYIAGTLGVVRLVLGLASLAAAWIAALAYALNPNLIYFQATAMTESLYLAFFIWAAVYFAEFVRATGAEADRPQSSLEKRSLEKCALMVSGAM